MASVKWTAIVFTCQCNAAANIYQEEFDHRQKKGLLPEDTLILTVEDPQSSVGSGGATLNSLLVVAEHLSAKQGFTVTNADVLQNAHILIFHMGRQFPYDACGRPFLTLPLVYDTSKSLGSLVSNLDVLLEVLTNRVSKNSPPGVWVCSTDMFLDIPENIASFDWKDVDVCALSVPATIRYAKQHGVYKVTDEGVVDDIIYQGSQFELEKCVLTGATVPLVAGVVFFSCRVAEKFLSFHVMPPLDSCTYIGLDSGTKPLQLSLFFDFMLPMCAGVTEESYIVGERSGMYGKSGKNPVTPVMKNARSLLWRELHNFRIKTFLANNGSHTYMDNLANNHHRHLLKSPFTDCKLWKNSKIIHASYTESTDIAENAVVMNAVLEDGVQVGAKTVVMHSHLCEQVHLGKDSYVSGISIVDLQDSKRVQFGNNIVLQSFHINIPTLGEMGSRHVLTVMGKFDDIHLSMWRGKSMYCNSPWVVFLNRTGISKEDLWDSDMEDDEKCVFNARLFPIFHTQDEIGLREILWLQGGEENDFPSLRRWRASWRISLEEIFKYLDLSAEFQWRRMLQFKVSQEIIRDTLINRKHNGLNDLFLSAFVDGFANTLLTGLDEVASEKGLPDIAARTLANIADVLGFMAMGKGGLRSGPAANQQWAKAFHLLERGEIAEGVKELAKERSNWLSRPDLLVRAARHYEGAAQILIRHAVMTARKYIKTSPCKLPPKGKWVLAEAPARIDIAGGWSDTPPITYEHGGAVTNAAILIDGKKPIGAKVKRIDNHVLILRIGADGSEGTHLIIKELHELSDYSQPHAPGALLKAAFCCASVIEFPSIVSLHDQLEIKYGGGFELHTWSNLPQGSGLGTSSILAGTVMAALWRVTGKTHDIDSLNHAVLHLEQMLTTGGGWQDQVGGLAPGIKIGHSKDQLPLRVNILPLKISEETLKAFNDRLVLVYTGKTRLARNLLQTVIRNWYARNPEIVETEDELVENAWDCGEAFESGDIKLVGLCMNRYWIQKKKMAPGCEPIIVTDIIRALLPHILGVSMAGAGGGGFMYILTKNPHAKDKIWESLSMVEGSEGITLHDACVDEEGLVVTVQDEPRQEQHVNLEDDTDYTCDGTLDADSGPESGEDGERDARDKVCNSEPKVILDTKLADSNTLYYRGPKQLGEWMY